MLWHRINSLLWDALHHGRHDNLEMTAADAWQEGSYPTGDKLHAPSPAYVHLTRREHWVSQRDSLICGVCTGQPVVMQANRKSLTC